MDTDQIMEYAQAVQAYKASVAMHEATILDANREVAAAAVVRNERELELREIIERLGSDPMNVLKKQRVRVADDQRAQVRAAILDDSGTEADIAKDTGLPIGVVRLSLRHLSRIGTVKKDGRGASAVWSAVREREWSEQTAPSIADNVNALLEREAKASVALDGETVAITEKPFAEDEVPS